MVKENQIEAQLVRQLTELKYNHRPDIVDRKTLEQNFKAKFEALNRVHLTPFINTSVDIEKIKEDNYCEEGDLIFADASEDLNDVGKSIEIVNLNSEKLVSGLHTLLARPLIDHFKVGFLGYLFIGLPYFKELYIPIPAISEQQRIASCLSAVDELITAQADKIEQLKLHKKGLMQGLFPVQIERR